MTGNCLPFCVFLFLVPAVLIGVYGGPSTDNAGTDAPNDSVEVIPRSPGSTNETHPLSNSVEEDEDISSHGKASRVTYMKCKCGVGNGNTKIVGGTEAGAHDWPWAAAIVLVDSNGQNPTPICGGTLINNRYVLTAAHCTPPLLADGPSYRVILGDNVLDGGNAVSRLVLKIVKIINHPKYNNKTQEYDAALLKLSETVAFNPNVLPICLGQLGRPFLNRLATIIGWGSTDFGQQTVNKLRNTRVKIISNADCAAAFGSQLPITDNEICAYTMGKDTCQGDSGGPMFVNRTTSVNVFKLIGITSQGIGCNEGKPGVYTRVQKIRSWIQARTSDDSRYCGNSFTP